MVSKVVITKKTPVLVSSSSSVSSGSSSPLSVFHKNLCSNCELKKNKCKCKEIKIDNESDEESDFTEPSEDWDFCDFENNYTGLLFCYKNLKEELQGTKEEINSTYGLKHKLQMAQSDALKLNNEVIKLNDELTKYKNKPNKYWSDLVTNKNEDIGKLEKQLKEQDNLIKSISKEKRELRKKLKNEESDNQDLIKERDALLFENDTFKLSISNLKTELKDLKEYSEDNEKNFFNISKELDDARTKAIELFEICKNKDEKIENQYLRMKQIEQSYIDRIKTLKEERDNLTERLTEKTRDYNFYWELNNERNESEKKRNDKIKELEDELKSSQYGILERIDRIATLHKEKNILEEDNKTLQNVIHSNNIINKAVDTYLLQVDKYGFHSIKIKIYQNVKQTDNNISNHISLASDNLIFPRCGNIAGYGTGIELNQNEKRFISEMTNEYLLKFEKELNDYILKFSKSRNPKPLNELEEKIQRLEQQKEEYEFYLKRKNAKIDELIHLKSLTDGELKELKEDYQDLEKCKNNLIHILKFENKNSGF